MTLKVTNYALINLLGNTNILITSLFDETTREV